MKDQKERAAGRVDQREFFVPDPDDPVEILKERLSAKRLMAEGRIAEGEAAYATAMAKWYALPPSVTSPHADLW
jgi:hypothetical protein